MSARDRKTKFEVSFKIFSVETLVGAKKTKGFSKWVIDSSFKLKMFCLIL